MKVRCNEQLHCLDPVDKLYGCVGCQKKPEFLARDLDWEDVSCECHCISMNPDVPGFEFPCGESWRCSGRDMYEKCYATGWLSLPVPCDDFPYHVLVKEPLCPDPGDYEDYYTGECFTGGCHASQFRVVGAEHPARCESVGEGGGWGCSVLPRRGPTASLLVLALLGLVFALSSAWARRMRRRRRS